MSTQEEIQSYIDNDDKGEAVSFVDYLAIYVDAKCQDAFKRGKYANRYLNGELECLNDRVDSLAIKMSKLEKGE